MAKAPASQGPSTIEQLTDWVLALVCSAIGCIMGIVWAIQGKPKAGKMIAVSIIADVVKSAIWLAVQSAGR